MAREKRHIPSFQCSSQNFVGRIAEGCFDFDPFLVREAFDLVQAAAAYDSDSAHEEVRCLGVAEPGQFALQFDLEERGLG